MISVTNIVDQNLGKFLQIAFTDGLRNQISEDFRDWEFVSRNREGDANGRELRFFFQRAFGPSAIQWAGVSPSGSFPAGSQISTSEHSAVYKEIDATVEIEYNLWNRARKSPAKYAEPLAAEIMSKQTASKRRMSIDYHGDGTGVVLTSDGAPAAAASRLVVSAKTGNADRGTVQWAEYGELVQFYSPDGVTLRAPTVGAGTFAYFTVEEKDRQADTVTLAARDASGTELAVTGAGTVADGDLLYRAGQPTRYDLSGAVTDDLNTITEVMAGIEALCNDDGSLVHGITMSGATATRRYDANGQLFDTSHIQRSLSQTKTTVGEGKYSWKQLIMAPEANDTLIESRETDRRFQTVDDGKRGTKAFGYVHGKDTLEIYTSEFCRKDRCWSFPEASQGQGKVMEYWGSDFEPVRAGGQGSEFFLRPQAGTHDRMIRTYLSAMAALICKHPAAVNCIDNFKVS